MNFLAHLYLTSSFDEVMVGNFIADSVKGKDFSMYTDQVVKGIKIHRLIDSFTDTHPVFCRSKLRLRDKYGKYSGVIADIFYDHFLAINWNDYSKAELKVFCDTVYAHMANNLHLMPLKVQFMFPRMVENNWLYNYRLIEGIQQVLIGMSKRTKFNSGMEKAIGDLKLSYQEFNIDFNEFFPSLIKQVKSVQA